MAQVMKHCFNGHRKQFTPANCAITRISGCYVDHEKEKRMTSKISERLHHQ